MATPEAAPPRVVLASTSRYRRELLARLVPAFDCIAPAVDESPLPGEPPASLAQRLARAKAIAGARQAPDALVIGSDQVACLGPLTLAKPGSFDRAFAQLRACSGHVLDLYTAVCVTGPAPVESAAHLDHVRVHFRTLADEEIRRYLLAEEPYDCAGSFKAEGLGIALMEAINSSDPTGIQGLPLIWVAATLRSRGLPIP